MKIDALSKEHDIILGNASHIIRVLAIYVIPLSVLSWQTPAFLKDSLLLWNEKCPWYLFVFPVRLE